VLEAGGRQFPAPRFASAIGGPSRERRRRCSFPVDVQRIARDEPAVHEPALQIDPHPLLKVAAFITDFPARLTAVATPPAALDALRLDGPAPLQRDEGVRGAVRDLLRQGGYKPTGRGKPASEYLVRAATEGALSSINAAVDVCNAVSLHSGLPISVVDLDRARAPFRIGVASEGSTYVFNASGQEIDLGGLLCLFDADGPCANAVRDAQRTKTQDETRATLSVVWGCAGFEARLREAERWYRSLLESTGATTRAVSSPENA
jgi:DNA/RNA-binding domain of Phe-tRNA-synthetase-like protein